jgi:hypothetical protein
MESYRARFVRMHGRVLQYHFKARPLKEPYHISFVTYSHNGALSHFECAVCIQETMGNCLDERQLKPIIMRTPYKLELLGNLSESPT